MEIYIHLTAIISTDAKIGDGTKIWVNVQVREQALILVRTVHFQRMFTLIKQ